MLAGGFFGAGDADETVGGGDDDFACGGVAYGAWFAGVLFWPCFEGVGDPWGVVADIEYEAEGAEGAVLGRDGFY